MIQRGGKERGPQFFSTDILCIFSVACLQLGLDMVGRFGEEVVAAKKIEWSAKKCQTYSSHLSFDFDL